MTHSAHTPITMSVFELLKAGPGPSSSHTIGPMRAGADFAALAAALPAELIGRARGVRVRLLGSLSATGKGHGTDRAVIAGLMGHEPETCPPSLLNDLAAMPAGERFLALPGKRLPLDFTCMEYGPVQHAYPYSNTLFIDLLDVQYSSASSGCVPGIPHFVDSGEDPLRGHILLSREYYSVGGGFLQWRGWEPEDRGFPVYPYVNMGELLVRQVECALPLDVMLMENEMAVTGADQSTVRARLDHMLHLMKDTVRRGCATRGLLPGAIGLARKAPVLMERAPLLPEFDRLLCCLNAYAYAGAEENAAGNLIVTAPTCGASGVVPAIVMFMQEHLGLGDAEQRKALLVAAALGLIAKQNAGIAGAELGCQGEIGVASAMAAGMLAHARGCAPKMIGNAAEIALEHHLGLTCDPVGGYVQIPCIERNAMGAVKAYNAALIACNENPDAHMVGYDDALAAMAEIGRDMSSKYKETSAGGLAACLVFC